MEREKNNTGLIVALIVLSILVAGLAGFIVYDKVIKDINKSSDSAEENDSTNKPTVYRDYDLEKAKELVDKYYTDGSWIFDDEHKLEMAFNQMENISLKRVSCKSLYGEDFYWHDDTVLACDNYSKVFEYSELNNEYKKLFGSLSNAPKTWFNIDNNELFNDFEVTALNYIEKTNQFATLVCRGTCGGPFGDGVSLYDVLSAQTDDEDNLYVIIGYVTFNWDWNDDEEVELQSNYDKSIAYKDKNDISGNYVKENQDKIYKTTIVFTNENGNYVFKNKNK
ncbi:MAG: hypothetical protein E7173_03440 [Firmicutes bacterium]|nr:hypothetical protein [Bacillota bacterium]